MNDKLFKLVNRLMLLVIICTVLFLIVPITYKYIKVYFDETVYRFDVETKELQHIDNKYSIKIDYSTWIYSGDYDALITKNQYNELQDGDSIGIIELSGVMCSLEYFNECVKLRFLISGILILIEVILLCIINKIKK